MATLTTDDGVKLYYEESGEGTPIVFVHEFAGDHRSWEPQLRYFARRYRCITYSARGYLPSEVPQGVERYSQERWREDIRCVLDALALPAAHVVGLSMGAFATLHFGMRYCAKGAPARALSLTLAGCGSGAHPADHANFQAAARALADTIDREGMGHLAATYGHGPARVQFRNKDPRGFAEAMRQLSEHSATGSSNTMRGYQARRPSLYELEGATLGGRIITQHVQATLGITPTTGGSFFDGYAEQTGRMWNAMRQILLLGAVDAQAEKAMVASATATFAALRNWCESVPCRENSVTVLALNSGPIHMTQNHAKAKPVA